jgi:TRAP-type mannitol/chloroaromatic compound transport system permease small subunit
LLLGEVPVRALLCWAQAIDAMTEWVGRLAGWLLPLAILVGTWNVASRYLGRWLGADLSSNAFLEAQWYLFSLVFLLGAGYVLKHNEHVRVDVLYQRWSRRRKAWVNLIGALVFLVPFCLVVLYFSWGFVANSWQILESSPDPGGLPRYPIKTVIPIGFGLLLLQGLAEAVKNWAVLRGQLPAQEASHER